MPYFRSKEEWQKLLTGTNYGSTGPHALAYEESYNLYNIMSEMKVYACFESNKDGNICNIFDVGSGYGRLAIALTSSPCNYLGIEPTKKGIDFSKRVFQPWPNLQFTHVDLFNAHYNPKGKVKPEEIVFPAADHSQDVVVFASVFTHVGSISICKRYLEETYRVLKYGGRALTTWFTSPPNEICSKEERTVFDYRSIIELCLGWKLLASRYGLTNEYHDQWFLTLEKI